MSSWHMGPSVSLQRESPTVTLLSFLTPKVVIQLADWRVLDKLQDRTSSSLLSAWPWYCRASYIFCKDTWKGKGGQGELSYLLGQEPASTHPHPLGPPLLPNGERVRVPLPSTALLSGTERYDSISLFSLTIPDTPQPFPFLFRMKQTRKILSFCSATLRHIQKHYKLQNRPSISTYCRWRSSRTQLEEENLHSTM